MCQRRVGDGVDALPQSMFRPARFAACSMLGGAATAFASLLWLIVEGVAAVAFEPVTAAKVAVCMGIMLVGSGVLCFGMLNAAPLANHRAVRTAVVIGAVSFPAALLISVALSGFYPFGVDNDVVEATAAGFVLLLLVAFAIAVCCIMHSAARWARRMASGSAVVQLYIGAALFLASAGWAAYALLQEWGRRILLDFPCFVVFPWSWVAMLSLFWAFIVVSIVMYRMKRIAASPVCWRCLYSTIGNTSGRCPECGFPTR